MSFDTLLCQYAEDLWQEGEPRTYLSNAFCGLAHMVQNLKGKLHTVLRSHKTGAIGACSARASADAKLARAFASRFIIMQEPATAACILLVCHGFLRIAELLSVRGTDLQVVNPRLSQLRLHTTNVRQSLMVTEQVSIDDKWMSTWVALLEACLPPADNAGPHVAFAIPPTLASRP